MIPLRVLILAMLLPASAPVAGNGGRGTVTPPFAPPLRAGASAPEAVAPGTGAQATAAELEWAREFVARQYVVDGTASSLARVDPHCRTGCELSVFPGAGPGDFGTLKAVTGIDVGIFSMSGFGLEGMIDFRQQTADGTIANARVVLTYGDIETARENGEYAYVFYVPVPRGAAVAARRGVVPPEPLVCGGPSRAAASLRRQGGPRTGRTARLRFLRGRRPGLDGTRPAGRRRDEPAGHDRGCVPPEPAVDARGGGALHETRAREPRERRGAHSAGPHQGRRRAAGHRRYRRRDRSHAHRLDAGPGRRRQGGDGGHGCPRRVHRRDSSASTTWGSRRMRRSTAGIRTRGTTRTRSSRRSTAGCALPPNCTRAAGATRT